MRICFDCANVFESNDSICPFCGADTAQNGAPREAYHLKPGTGLKNERYIMGRAIGYGGFGVTYAAFDTLLLRRVAIKEFLPSDFATRIPGANTISVFGGDEATACYIKGLQSFTDEAERLAKFNNVEGIVGILDCFSENDTAYMVMEMLDGKTVKQILEERGPLSYDDTLPIILSILNTLDKVHGTGIIHRDISPDNVFITDDGKVKLLDFGAARYATANASKSLSVILKPGYAPEEQYRSRGDQGPWSDVYAVGATMYKMLTGITPEEALERAANDTLILPSKLGIKLPKGAEAALNNALIVKADYRTRSAEDFANELLYGTEIKVPPKEKKPWSLPKWVYYALAGLLSAGAIFGVLLLTGAIRFSRGGHVDKDASGNLAVPNLVGKTESEAKAEHNEWSFIIKGSDETDEVEVGCIMAQDPAFGSYVPEGTNIDIKVNKGKKAAEGTMPFLRGSDVAKTEKKLEGFVLVYENTYDEAVEKGLIAYTDPDYNEPVADGQEVKVYVSLGGMLNAVQLIPDDEVVELEVDGGSAALSAKILPANTDTENVEITWEVDDTSVAEYVNNEIKPVSVGETTVTVTASMVNEQTGETVTVTDSTRVVVKAKRTPVPTAAPTPKPTAAQTPTPRPVTQRPVTPTSKPATQRPVTPKPTTPPPAQTPAPTPNPTATPTPTPKLPLTPTPRPTATPNPTPHITPTPRPTAAPTPSPAATPTRPHLTPPSTATPNP